MFLLFFDRTNLISFNGKKCSEDYKKDRAIYLRAIDFIGLFNKPTMYNDEYFQKITKKLYS